VVLYLFLLPVSLRQLSPRQQRLEQTLRPVAWRNPPLQHPGTQHCPSAVLKFQLPPFRDHGLVQLCSLPRVEDSETAAGAMVVVAV
jgi:hypothetical protein